MVNKQKSLDTKNTVTKSPKYGYLVLFVFSVVLIGSFGYFFKRDAILKNQMRHRNDQEILAALEKKDEEIRDLKRLVHQLEAMPSIPTKHDTKSDLSLKKKISDNFQKILMQQKLTRRLLNGKDFSLELHTLEVLLSGKGKKALESLRQYATEGIPTSFDIEEYIKNDIQQSKSSAQKHNVFGDLLSQFFTISRADKKQKLATLILLIRQDRMHRAIEFAEDVFPSKQRWHSMLKKRLVVKRTLKTVEQAIIDSVKL